MDTTQCHANMVAMWSSDTITCKTFHLHAHLSVHIEAGRGLLEVNSNSSPADVLVDGWERAKPEACDVTVTSSLTSGDACKSAGVAAYIAVLECSSSDSKCQELGWVCIPFAVEM